MGARLKQAAIVLCAGLGCVGPAASQPGGLNAHGCHNDRGNGSYHCHRGPSVGSHERHSSNARRGGAVRNCTEARAVDAAPVRRGDPGYGTHLDRDRDGVGSE